MFRGMRLTEVKVLAGEKPRVATWKKEREKPDSLAFCYSGFGHKTEQNREESAAEGDAARSSGRRGTGLRR